MKAFLSVESSCSSLNSFCAAKVDASSTDHAAVGGRRRAKEGIQKESKQEISSAKNPWEKAIIMNDHRVTGPWLMMGMIID